jgi:5'-3' exonuclease
MGIKFLNNYFKKKCTEKSYQRTHLNQFRGKTISVDISIYLYKFLAESAHVTTNETDNTNTVVCDMNIYMENLYLFLALFYYYHIIPIFVFDGKPPPEKRAILKKRYNDKKTAETLYDEMYKTQTGSESDLHELCKKMVRIKTEHLENAKVLISAFGFQYIQSEAEADQICVQYVQQGVAWACLSDDTDLFLHGCARIIRNMNCSTHSCTVYYTESLLEEIGISRRKLVETLVVHGFTDYYQTVEKYDLYEILDKAITQEKDEDLCSTYDADSDISVVCDLFMKGGCMKGGCMKGGFIKGGFIKGGYCTKNSDSFVDAYKVKGIINIPKIEQIMSNYGFVFVM